MIANATRYRAGDDEEQRVARRRLQRIPTPVDTKAPETAPANPPSPTTDATAVLGRGPRWWSAEVFPTTPDARPPPSPMMATAAPELMDGSARNIGTTASAHSSIAPLRAALALTPFA